VTVANPRSVSRGVKEVWVNGKRVKGTVIPYDEKDQGKSVAVKVVMGEARGREFRWPA
jgi:hypothetical protein